MGKQIKIAVDLDDTLAEYDGWRGLNHIGDPQNGAKQFMEQLREAGHYLIIYTTRTNASVNRPEDEDALGLNNTIDRQTAPIAAWMEQHQIPYDEIYADEGKPLANAFVDDRVVQHQQELGFGITLTRLEKLLQVKEGVEPVGTPTE